MINVHRLFAIVSVGALSGVFGAPTPGQSQTVQCASKAPQITAVAAPGQHVANKRRRPLCGLRVAFLDPGAQRHQREL
jgi:hypothetical protein